MPTLKQWSDCIQCREERVEGGSRPDQDQEQQAEEVEGGQGGEGGEHQGGAEEQGEPGQDCQVKELHLFTFWANLATREWLYESNCEKITLRCLNLGAASLVRRRRGASSPGRSSSPSLWTASYQHMATLVR